MKKIPLTFFSISLLMTGTAQAIVGGSTGTLDGITCAKIPSCEDLGYTNGGSCYYGFVACPFDKNLKNCDKEADTNDFKFTLPNSKSGWSTSSGYDGRFIVGIGSNYCGLKTPAESGSDSLGPHTHSVTTSSHISMEYKTYGLADGGWHTVYSGADSSTASRTSTTSGSSETRPTNYAVDGRFYTAKSETKKNQSETFDADTTPKCADLGYVDKKKHCPGTYLKCPFDDTNTDDSAVMCDMQAQAGEIKFSLDPTEADGWLLCDGEALSAKGSKYVKSELTSILSSAGFGNSVPNYQGTFLRIKGSAGSGKASESSYKTKQLSAYGQHYHNVTYSYNYPTQSSERTIEGSGKNRTQYEPLANKGSTTATLSAKGSGETYPAHFSAYLMIYSGKVNQ